MVLARAKRVRYLAAAIVAALGVSGCGSGAASPKVDAVPVVSTAPVPHVEPCGPGTAAASDETGITPDAITVGVVADITGINAEFEPSWQAMQAFAAFCNSLGGISGRRLDVKLFDTNIFSHRRAILGVVRVGLRARRLGVGLRR